MDLYKTDNSSLMVEETAPFHDNAKGNAKDTQTRLNQEHWKHLENEGFSANEILHLIKLGVRSITEKEAREKRIGCTSKDGSFVSSSGLYFPFTDTFGQMRCDNPPISAVGKPCKYLTPCKSQTQAYLPDNVRVVTEGFKDALAGTLKGGIVTGALAGVSHFRKALEPDSKLIIIFDADGWNNPQVFTNLFNAGLYLNGRIQLVPEIPNEPKAGLCEFFKAGKTADDYKQLIDSAMNPAQFLAEIPKHWKGLSKEAREKCSRAILRLAALHLSKEQVQGITDALALTLKDVEQTILYPTAQRTVSAYRKTQKFDELAKLRGSYVWAVISSDKILKDFMGLVSRFGHRLRFNTLKKQVELDNKVLPIGSAKVYLNIEYGFQATCKTDFPDIVLQAAKYNSYSPIAEYLESVHKQHGYSAEILDNLAFRYFGQDEPIYNRMLIKTLIGAVARAYEPGCKMDTALILQGKQGARKSTFFKTLAGGDEYFDDSLGSVGEKDEKLKLHCVWFVEWAELETVFRKKDVAATKAFLTCTTDHLRPPYGRDIEKMHRASVIVGSTNEDEFLSDSTGNRRFWVIPVKKRIDIDLLKQERDQIWASIVDLYKRGEQWWLTDLEEESAAKIADQFQSSDPWAEKVLEFVEHKDFVTIPEIMEKLGIETNRQDKALQARVSNILKHYGFTRERKRFEGRQVKVWVKPSLDRPHQHEVDLEAQETVKPDATAPQNNSTRPSDRPSDLPEWVQRGAIAVHTPSATRFPIYAVKAARSSGERKLTDSAGNKYLLKECVPA